MGRPPTATPAQPDLDNDLNFLRALREPVSAQRLSRAAAGSIAFHVVAFLLFWFAPDVEPYRVPHGITPEDLKRSTVLIIPKDLLRQQAPQGPASSAGSAAGRQQQTAAATTPRAEPKDAPRRFRPPSPSPGEPSDTSAPMIQAPAIDAPSNSVAAPSSILGTGAPAPLAPPARKPKATFEPVGGAAPPSPPKPLTPAEEALRAALRSGGAISLPVDPSQDTSGLPELRSDPKGVDFTQYLVQVRTKVKKNWLLVIPDAARRGLRGVVQVDFAIDRRGITRNVKIASPSGTQAFDLAAVAGITASYPFPPLPAEYKGDEIELRMTFTYSTTQR